MRSGVLSISVLARLAGAALLLLLAAASLWPDGQRCSPYDVSAYTCREPVAFRSGAPEPAYASASH